jgi:hypothetical protein
MMNALDYIEASETFVIKGEMHHFYTVNPRYIEVVFEALKAEGKKPSIFKYDTGIVDILVKEPLI